MDDKRQDSFDRAIDEAARALTDGEPSPRFRAAVIARVTGAGRRGTHRAWLLAPLAAAAVLAGLLVAQYEYRDAPPVRQADIALGVTSSPAAPGTSTQHPAPAPGTSTQHPITTAPGTSTRALSTQHPAPAPGTSTQHPITTAPGTSTLALSTQHPAPIDPSPLSDLAPPRLTVAPLVIDTLDPDPSIRLDPLQPIASIAIAPLDPEGDQP
jgi:hypothetical protein